MLHDLHLQGAALLIFALWHQDQQDRTPAQLAQLLNTSERGIRKAMPRVRQAMEQSSVFMEQSSAEKEQSSGFSEQSSKDKESNKEKENNKNYLNNNYSKKSFYDYSNPAYRPKNYFSNYGPQPAYASPPTSPSRFGPQPASFSRFNPPPLTPEQAAEDQLKKRRRLEHAAEQLAQLDRQAADSRSSAAQAAAADFFRKHSFTHQTH